MVRNHISGKLRECPQLVHEQDWLCDYPGSAKREKETFSGWDVSGQCTVEICNHCSELLRVSERGLQTVWLCRPI